MRINKSPWINQLDQDRRVETLKTDLESETVILGAGIAGVSTAFFALKYTDKKIALVEGRRLAHGATGHNAGQVVAYFERPLADIAKEFGEDLAIDGWKSVESAWALMNEIYTDAGLTITFSRFTGYVGFSSLYQTELHLEDLLLKRKHGVTGEECFISAEAPFLSGISKRYDGLYTVIPKREVLSKLETENEGFHTLVSDQRGCVNSALFCEKTVEYLLKNYPTRFSFYEDTYVSKIVLREKGALLDAGKHTIQADKIVLCTNGFENLEILNEGGLAIDTKFHHLVKGEVGYMSGYLEKMNKPPIAISYFLEDTDPTKENPYFYLTRRPHELGDEKHNLICVGGPEAVLDDREEYYHDYDYPEVVHTDIDAFIKRVYDRDPNKKIEYQFTWHGLMGYTPNRIRLVGAEPKNPILLYNLGCNGIGILPSIFGGRRISKMLAGERVEKSIFDPK